MWRGNQPLWWCPVSFYTVFANNKQKDPVMSHDKDDPAAPVPAVEFERELNLVVRELTEGVALTRLRGSVTSDIATLALQECAKKLIGDIAQDMEQYERDPRATKTQLLKLAALLATDRMLSHETGILCEDHGDGRLTISPAYLPSNEGVDLKLLDIRHL